MHTKLTIPERLKDLRVSEKRMSLQELSDATGIPSSTLGNYEKDENISDTTKYNDRFVDPQTFIAISKSNMTLQDDKMIPFINANKNHTSIHIFIRKNKLDEESKEFYYLGLGNILNIKQETMANNSPVCEILYQLDQPVRKDIYDYIVNN